MTKMEEKMKNQQEYELLQAIANQLQDSQDFRELMMKYNCAIKEVSTKLEVLNEDFRVRNRRNPIERISSRIKTAGSIVEKLKRNGWDITVGSIAENLHDVAGIRVICSFVDDIYQIAEVLIRQDDIKLIRKKDYIKHPKGNGYRSLHLILEIPIFLTDKTEHMQVEVQIRTIAMDFWASLEHKVRYKKNIPYIQDVEKRLKHCAEESAKLDIEMQKINQEIDAILVEQSQ